MPVWQSSGLTHTKKSGQYRPLEVGGAAEIDRPMIRSIAAATALGSAATLMIAMSIAADLRGPVPDEPSPDWRTGPIRYILTVDEDVAYRALDTADERRAYIEDFWKALDPTPATAENERRDEFWRRVADSVDLYLEKVPGWKTDRGKAHILMGPPDRRLRQGTQEVWIYDALPRPDAPPEVRITFTRMMEGEYRMRAGDLRYMDSNAEAGGVPAGEAFLAAPGSGSSPRMIKERIRMTDFPAAVITSDYYVQTLDFRWRFYFYRGKDDETLVSFVISLPVSQFNGSDSGTLGPDVNVSAMFSDVARKRATKRLAGTMRTVGSGSAPADRVIVFQSAWSLEPGAYDSTLMVADQRSRRGATAQGKVEVPEYDRGLALSSIVLGRLRGGSGSSAAPGGQQMLTVPDPSAAFAQGERMAISYQVYNARRRDDSISLDVEYDFFLKRGEELKPLGKPVVQSGQSSESQGFEVTLQGWPQGSYSVRITVTDRFTHKSATAEAEFQVVPAGPGS